MKMRHTLSFLSVILTAVTADWVNIVRLEIANWALAQSVMPPEGVMCTEKGHKPKGCHCWEPNGKPSSGQDDDCDGPKGCLIYDTDSSGNFNYANRSNASFPEWMKLMNVPAPLVTALLNITATPNIDYQTVNVTMSDKDEPSIVTAHVASARRDTNNIVYVGYALGSSKGDLIQPMKRKDVHAGDCHGTTRGMKERDFTSDERKAIISELLPAAFKQVAKSADPGAPPGPPGPAPPTPPSPPPSPPPPPPDRRRRRRRRKDSLEEVEQVDEEASVVELMQTWGALGGDITVKRGDSETVKVVPL